MLLLCYYLHSCTVGVPHSTGRPSSNAIGQMADDGLYDDIEDISSREEPVAVSSTPLKDDESGVYVKTFDENQAPAGKDAAPVVERATNMAQNTMTALYVGNLHWWVTDAQLQTMCEEYGKLRTPPRFFEDRVNGKSKVRHPPAHNWLRLRRRLTRCPPLPPLPLCAGLRHGGLHRGRRRERGHGRPAGATARRQGLARQLCFGGRAGSGMCASCEHAGSRGERVGWGHLRASRGVGR